MEDAGVMRRRVVERTVLGWVVLRIRERRDADDIADIAGSEGC